MRWDLPVTTWVVFAALAGLSVLTLTVVIFKLMQFRRLGVGHHKLGEVILDDWLNGRPDEAQRKAGKTGEILLQSLESRLDNVVYRAGFASTRRQARQLVVHGHFLVNGKKVNIPSYRVSAYDIIDIAPKSMNTLPFVIARETHHERTVPAWLTVRPNKGRILVHQLPVRDQITIDVTEQLIVELYSK